MPINPQLISGLMGRNYVAQPDEDNWLTMQAKRNAVKGNEELRRAQVSNYESEIANRNADNARAEATRVEGVITAAANKKKQLDDAAKLEKEKAEKLEKERHGSVFSSLYMNPTQATLDAHLANGDINQDEYDQFNTIPSEKWKPTAAAGVTHNLGEAALRTIDKEQSALAKEAADVKATEAKITADTEARAQTKAQYEAWADSKGLPKNALTRMQFDRLPKNEAQPIAAVQEFEYAKANGYKGSWNDYQNMDANRKRQVINVNAETGRLDREIAAESKPFEKVLTESTSQLEKIQDARDMINGTAASQALGIPKVLTALVGGQGTGVRITNAELNAIASARGIKGDIEGWLSQASGEGKLTETQQKQLTEIIDDVKARIEKKRTSANETVDNIKSARNRDEVIEHGKRGRAAMGGQSTGPKAGDVKQYQGADYKFDGKQWVRQGGK